MYLKHYLEKVMAPHSSTFAWKIPWMEEPGRLQSMGSRRVGHDWSDLASAAAAYANKVMLKILQARPQQYVNHELPDVQAGFRKGRDILLNFLSCMWSLILNYPWKTFSQLERFAQELVIKWESKENRQLAQRYHEFPLKKIPRELHYVLWMIYVIFHLSRA